MTEPFYKVLKFLGILKKFGVDKKAVFSITDQFKIEKKPFTSKIKCSAQPGYIEGSLSISIPETTVEQIRLMISS